MSGDRFWDRPWGGTGQLYTTCTSPIMHLISPPPSHPNIFFSPGYYSRPKGNWKQCLSKILGGQIRCIMGDVQVTYWPFFPLSLVTVPEVFAIVNSTQFNFLLVSNVALLQWYGHLLLMLPLLFGLGLQGMLISLGFWEGGCPKQGDAHITVTALKKSGASFLRLFKGKSAA